MILLLMKDSRLIGIALGIGLGIYLKKKQEDKLCKQKYNKTSFCIPSWCSGGICSQDCSGKRPANHYNNWKKNNC